MAKPDWGTKRQCTNAACGVKFYDMARTPVVCPACGTEIDLTPLTRMRRSRGGDKGKAAAAAAAVVVPVVALVEDEEAAAVIDDDDDEEVLEDASELGEDDDVAEVLDTPLEEEEGA